MVGVRGRGMFPHGEHLCQEREDLTKGFLWSFLVFRNIMRRDRSAEKAKEKKVVHGW